VPHFQAKMNRPVIALQANLPGSGELMKYFFLSDGWVTGRVWEFGGLWNEQARRRGPYVERQALCIQDNGDTLWLYKAEDDILMLEVKPKASTQDVASSAHNIGQVVLKRLLSAEQVIDRLCEEKKSLLAHDAAQANCPFPDSNCANSDPINRDPTDGAPTNRDPAKSPRGVKSLPQADFSHCAPSQILN
jgi:hypothetical protein